MRFVLILFIAMPIIEMWLLIKVGSHIGALTTIALVALTAFIGLGLLRHQGTMTLLKARTRMSAGEIPAREMADGLFLAVAGALLLTPGFVTDAIGFACLTPGIRTVIMGFLSRHVFHSSNFTMGGAFSGGQKTTENSAGSETLEGEFQREDDKRLKK